MKQMSEAKCTIRPRAYTLAELDGLIGMAVKDRYGNINFIKAASRTWLDGPRVVLTPSVEDEDNEITVSARSLMQDFTFYADGRLLGRWV